MGMWVMNLTIYVLPLIVSEKLNSNVQKFKPTRDDK